MLYEDMDGRKFKTLEALCDANDYIYFVVKHQDLRGVEYNTVEEMCKANGISPHVYQTRKQMGYPKILCFWKGESIKDPITGNYVRLFSIPQIKYFTGLEFSHIIELMEEHSKTMHEILEGVLTQLDSMVLHERLETIKTKALPLDEKVEAIDGAIDVTEEEKAELKSLEAIEDDDSEDGISEYSVDFGDEPTEEIISDENGFTVVKLS